MRSTEQERQITVFLWIVVLIAGIITFYGAATAIGVQALDLIENTTSSLLTSVMRSLAQFGM
jgi:hypothetical protein